MNEDLRPISLRSKVLPRAETLATVDSSSGRSVVVPAHRTTDEAHHTPYNIGIYRSGIIDTNTGDGDRWFGLQSYQIHRHVCPARRSTETIVRRDMTTRLEHHQHARRERQRRTHSFLRKNERVAISHQDSVTLNHRPRANAQEQGTIQYSTPLPRPRKTRGMVVSNRAGRSATRGAKDS